MSETCDIVERAEAWLADVETEMDADIIVSGLLAEIERLRAELERQGERIEGWAFEHELADPDDPWVTVYRSRSHPHLRDDEGLGLSVVPVRLARTTPDSEEIQPSSSTGDNE
jgi:hypothetical protein